MPAAYHHTEQLRLRHLKVGEIFRFDWDVKTPPWTKFDGTPGEQSVVYSKEQTYQLVSPRKIQPVKGYWGSNLQRRVSPMGKPSTLGKGLAAMPVNTSFGGGLF